MKAEKQPELRWQCLNCYKTYKGPDAEQKALDCCGSIVQGWWANYNKSDRSGTAAEPAPFPNPYLFNRLSEITPSGGMTSHGW